MPEVVIPYRPRPQLLPLHQRRERFACVVMHRRAGKTVGFVNHLIRSALTCPLPEPRTAYVAPYYSQAKDVAWGYLKRYTATIPGVRANESELRVDFPNGGRVRLYGADNYDRMRGLYFDDVAVDEYGMQDPRGWQEVIRPALADRGGAAMIGGTPNGVNHFADLWERTQSDPDWFTMKLPASESGLLPASELAAAQREMSAEQYAAEFECSFAASIVGSYFGREMEMVESEGRITRVPYQPEAAVDTWWDIGVKDSTTIWFTQTAGREIHLIDYIEDSGPGLPHYIKLLKDRPYVYGEHHAPHDIRVREWGNDGKARIDVARGFGINFKIVPDIPKQDGIDAARAFLARCWFDREKTERGRMALQSYRREWDAKRKIFNSTPQHDWASNGADAFRYLSVGHKYAQPKVRATASPFSRPAAQQISWMSA